MSPSSANKEGAAGAGGSNGKANPSGFSVPVRLQPFLHPEIVDTSPCELRFACRLADESPPQTRLSCRVAALNLPRTRNSSLNLASAGGDTLKTVSSNSSGDAPKSAVTASNVSSGEKDNSGAGENGAEIDAPTNPKQRKSDEPSARRARTPSLERNHVRPSTPLAIRARPSFLVGESCRNNSAENNTEGGDESTPRRQSLQYGIAAILLRSNARAIAVHSGDSRVTMLRCPAIVKTSAGTLSADSSGTSNMIGQNESDGGSAKIGGGDGEAYGSQWFEIEYAPERCVQECVFTVCIVIHFCSLS